MLAKHVEKTIIPLIRQEVPQKNDFKFRQDNDGVLVVMNKELRCLDYLNPTASIIYRMCNGKTSLGEIIDYFSQTYPEHDKQQIALDIIMCVRNLQGRLLLKRCSNQQRGGRPY